MDRRRFLGALAGAALGVRAASPSRASASRPVHAHGFGDAGRRPLDAVGLQLYTVRTLMAEDIERTLERVAGIGYRYVEFAGYFERTPAEIRAMLDRTGLAAPAAHVPLDAVRGDADRTIDAARRIGHRYLVVPWLPTEMRRTLDDYRRVADHFNRIGERARRSGLRFGYHNHDFEFEPIDGRVPYDVLLARTDPELVAHEMDLYWVTRGGGDPLAYFARFPGRFELVHAKDMDATPERGMTDVGDGIIEFPRIFARARQAGIRHLFVEHDRPAAPIETIRTSYEYLRRLES